MTNDTQSLIALRNEATNKLKQAEADVYFFQGYIKALDDILEPATPLEDIVQGVEVTNDNEQTAS